MASAEVILRLQNNASPQIVQTANATRALVAEELRAQQATLAHAQAVARLQQAQGNHTAAQRTLQTALAGVTTQTNGVIRAQTQLANLQRGGGALGAQFADGIKNGLLGILGPAALATAALAAIPAAIDLAKLGAQADLVRQRFDLLAIASKTTGDALLGALRSASGGEISDLNLQLAANKANLLGVADSAAEFGVLMAIARDRAQALGISTTQAFDDLVTGLGRGSALILDNLGIIVDANETNKAYAASIGKTVGALTENEKKQALVNAVIAQGNKTIAETGGALTTAAAGQARLGASVDNLKAKFGELIAVQASGAVGDVAGAVSGITSLVSAYGKLAGAYKGVGDTIGTVMNPIGEYNRLVLKYGADALRYLGTLTEAAGITPPVPPVPVAATVLAPSLADAAAAAQLRYADALAQGGVQARAAALANQQKSDSDKVASVDAQTHALAEQALADQAQKAGEALLKAGPAGAATAALLAGSSQQVDVLTAAFYRLAAAKELADAAKTNAAALTDQRAGERDGGSSRTAAQITFQTDQDRKAAQIRAAEQARLDAANDQLRLSRARTSGAKIAELQRQQAATSDPVEKIRLQTQIEQERNSAAKSHTSELNKQLKLNEGIYDSVQKQRDAALDIEKLAITGRQADRADAQKVKTAQAILAKLVGRTDARAEGARATAQDVIALADVEHRQRAAELANKGATAGASIVNGRLLQSVNSGALPPPPGATGAGALPPPPGGTRGAAGGTTTSTVLTLRLVDGANRILAELTEPYLMDAIMRGLDQADVGIG